MKTTQAPGRSAGPAPASARRFYGRSHLPASGEPENAEPVEPSIEQAERFGHSLDRLRQPSAEPANAPVQRVIMIRKGGLTLKKVTAQTSGLAAALVHIKEGERSAVIDTLNDLAGEDKEHKFSDWDNAITRAKSVAKSQSSRIRVVRNRDIPKKPVESEDSSGSDSSSEASDAESDFSEFSSDNDEGLPEVNFDQGGRFASESGKKLSKTRRSALIGSLGLTHTDTGHGPHKTDKQLSDAARQQKGAGKFTSDKAMFRALKRTKRAIRKEEIDPERGGNQFIRMPRSASVAFKKSDATAKKVETRKGRVFFKDKKIKSIHPFAEDAAEDADIDE